MRSVWACAAFGLFSGVLCFCYAGDMLIAACSIFSVIAVVLLIVLSDRRAGVIAAAAMFCAGGAYISYRSDLSHHAVYGCVNKYSQINACVYEQTGSSGEINKYLVRAYNVSFGGGESKNISELMQVSTEKEFMPGDTAVFRGFVKETKRETDPLRFDMALYNRCRGIYFTMYGAYAQKSGTQSGMRDALYTLPAKLRRKMCDTVKSNETGDKAAIMCAVLTGRRFELSDEADALFTGTGIKRYLYSARIHLILLLIFAGVLTKRMKRSARDVLYVVMFTLYALANSTQPSFMRVFVTAAAAIAYVRLRGINDFPDIIGISVLICGAVNPYILLDSGFQMGIAATIIIKVFYGRLHELMCTLVRDSSVLRLVLLWIAANAGLAPLSALLFGSLAPYSVIASVPFIASVGAAYITAPLYFVCCALFGSPGVGGIFMNVPVYAILYLPRLIEKLPYYYIMLPRPDAVFMMMYYCALAALVCNVSRKARERLICAAVGAFAAFSVIYIRDLGTVDLHFVDVGQGDAQIIELRHKSVVLIDGGGSAEYSDYDVGRYEYMPYLSACGITHADKAFVSHYHRDHVMGIITALENIKIDTLFLPGCEPGNEYRIMLEETARRRGVRIEYINEDTVMDIGKAALHIYAPRCTDGEDLNDMSLVMKLEYGDFSALFTGDITSVAERELVSEGVDIDADVLKAPHHGSAYSSCDEFIGAVSPRITVFEVGRDNMFGFPTDEAVERYNKYGAGMLSTAAQGDIVISGDRSGIKRILHH